MSYNSDIAVTVYCIVYNHEKYLRDALDGFIMQKTNFKFASPDLLDKSGDASREYIYEKDYMIILNTYHSRLTAEITSVRRFEGSCSYLRKSKAKLPIPFVT